jgi:hypothetical protein
LHRQCLNGFVAAGMGSGAAEIEGLEMAMVVTGAGEGRKGSFHNDDIADEPKLQLLEADFPAIAKIFHPAGAGSGIRQIDHYFRQFIAILAAGVAPLAEEYLGFESDSAEMLRFP